MMQEEDADAWRTATEGTIPLLSALQARAPLMLPLSRPIPPIQHPMRAPELHPVALSAPLPSLDANMIRRIRLGRVAVDYTLDLHGMTQAVAYAAFAQCITYAYGAGMRLVLVITGKGRVSEAGVLRTALPKWCDEPALRAFIVALHKASPTHGGDGAYYVRIRKYE
jgi:DNA-nicking Smr family endonuclease